MKTVMIFKQPADGWTTLEQLLMRAMICRIYEKLPDPLDKFILLANFEAGYTQVEIARMIGISQAAINRRLREARKFLRQAKLDNTL